MFTFILGLFIGCCFGVFLTALLNGSREGREAVFPEREDSIR